MALQRHNPRFFVAIGGGVLFLWSLGAMIRPCHGLSLSMTASSTKVVSKPKILSVGLAAVDFVATVDHYPEPDEKMRSSALLVEGGGNAANTACAIAGLLQPSPDCDEDDDDNAAITLLTAVGDDPNGNIILDGMNQRNVHVLAERYPGSSPFSYILSCDLEGTNTRTCVHQPSTGDLSTKFCLDADKVPLSDYTAVHFDVRYPQAAVALAKQCVRRGIPYSVDVERPREGLADIMRDATVVVCNSNYCDTVDTAPAANAAEKLIRVMQQQAPRAKVAVQTLGEKGSCLVFLDDAVRAEMAKLAVVEDILQDTDKSLPKVTLSTDGSLICQAFTGGKIVDTTGAGDSFIGGFLAAIWSYVAAHPGDETISSSLFAPQSTPVALARALRIASRVAARKIEKAGARSGLPLLADDAILQADFDALYQEATADATAPAPPNGATSDDASDKPKRSIKQTLKRLIRL